MSQQSSFYGLHTERKLQAVEGYLNSFLQVVSKWNFETVYIDAFAGTGTIPLDLGGDLLREIDDAKNFVEGSALRALQLPRKFDKYIFIEQKAKKIDELKKLISGQANISSEIQYVCGNAETALIELCPMLQRTNVRSVVFLDPFGSQVDWATLEALAATKHVDLWYLFPAGLSVNRQISGGGRFTPEQERSLNRLFGPHNWKSRLLKTEQQTDLFGALEKTEKSATIDDITRFMIECMSSIFEGGVCRGWLPLGRDGAHWYSLLFAMANSSRSAKRIGHEVAKHLMTME